MLEVHAYRPTRTSPTTLAIVIGVHAVAIAALMLAKMDVPIHVKPPPLVTTFIPETVDPPEVKPDEIKPEVPTERPVTVERPIVETDIRPIETVEFDRIKLPDPTPWPVDNGIGSGEIVTPRTPDPVQVAARMDSRSVRQPPYPASEERAGVEGTVKVRLTVGADGRVRTVERVSAISDALFEATRRHALRAWRFRPATLDGRPVESSLVMTVVFELRSA